jgi:hypothetical protein
MKTTLILKLLPLCLTTVSAENPNLLPIQSVLDVDADADGSAVRFSATGVLSLGRAGGKEAPPVLKRIQSSVI